jgi:hypothetical protein
MMNETIFTTLFASLTRCQRNFNGRASFLHHSAKNEARPKSPLYDE